MSNLVATRRSRSGLSTLGWLLLTAAVAAFTGSAVVAVGSVVRDVGVDAGSFSARFRAARIHADSLTREWRAHHPANQFEADSLNRRYWRAPSASRSGPWHCRSTSATRPCIS